MSICTDPTALEMEEFDTEAKGKQKRHWESWAKADKDLFFEAISEFGKDFDKICSFMDKKVKTRGKSVKDCEPRNKDQIRYFYYRTWKQISKAVSLQPSESKRIQHEIYCMICYGELRKKCRGFGKKDLKRLDDLVRTGSTTVRHKGRKIRIKPPNCRFLKKLSDEEDKSTREQGAIPENIDVELFPRTNQEWTMAQKLAFNPRIRLNNLPITLKVKSLMKLLLRRFEKGIDVSNFDETVVKLFPPKGLVLPESDVNSALQGDVSLKEASPMSSHGNVGTKVTNASPCISIQNTSGHLSSDSHATSSIGASAVTTVVNKGNFTQTPMPQIPGSNLLTGPVDTRLPITALAKPNMPDNSANSFVHITPPTVLSEPSGISASVPLGNSLILPVVDRSLNSISTSALPTANVIPITVTSPVMGTNVISSMPSGNAIVANTHSLMLGGNVVQILPAGNPTKSSTQAGDKHIVSPGQNISVNIQGPIPEKNVVSLSAEVTQLAVAGSRIPTMACTALTSLKDRACVNNSIPSLPAVNVTANNTQASAGEPSAISTLSSNTIWQSTSNMSQAGDNAKVDSVAPANVEVPPTCTTNSQPKDSSAECLTSNVTSTNASFFPITFENCIEKDLQACCLALNRPDVIRLEYELEVYADKSKQPSLSSFDKLVLLAQRDLCKALKVTTQQIKASSNSRLNQLSKPVEVFKPSQAVKPIYIATTFAEPQWVPVPRHGLQEGIPVNAKPVIISASSLKPSVGLVPSLKNVKQRKVVSRLRPIQPASKTLMAKAVAVNIVPQPAQLAQFAQVPAVSTQLINSGSSSLSNVNLTATEPRPSKCKHQLT